MTFDVVAILRVEVVVVGHVVGVHLRVHQVILALLRLFVQRLTSGQNRSASKGGTKKNKSISGFKKNKKRTWYSVAVENFPISGLLMVMV